MKTFIDDFKYTWNKPNNSLVKLIIINVIVWVFLNLCFFISAISKNNGFFDFFYENLAIHSSPSKFLFKPWTIITYFFTHHGFFHILYNMIFMFWFGKIIEEFLGSNKLKAIYIIGGLAGGITFILSYNLLGYGNSTMVGASAGVFAIVVGAATFQPDYRMYLIFIGPVKIKYVAAVAVFTSFIALPVQNTGGNIAHMAGALVGFLFIIQLQKGNDWSKPVTASLDFLANLFKPRSKIKITYKKKANNIPKNKVKTGPGMPDQAVVDAILDKISDTGYEKLTKEEKQILFKASQNQKKSE
ncbi:rhomboid family protein [Flexithrix dorotheae]|uniref:rhomboid family protein n=1 Tax=Flexithrix dorotheae TaxID=70993 RepID=UPI0003780014|nr:rhomboid family intramembrane serine protease [Flexithrix dorotheae]